MEGQYIVNESILKMVSQRRRDAIIRPEANNHKYSVNLCVFARDNYFENINHENTK